MATTPILYFEQTGCYDTEVVGESRYQKELNHLEKYDQREFDYTTLWLEDYNEYDKNAVAVVIEGDTIGYLSRRNAIAYRQKITELGYPDSIGACYSKLIGGHILDNGEKASFGVVLDLDIDNLVIQEIKTIEAWEPKIKEQTFIDKILYGDKKANTIDKFLSRYIKTKYPLFVVIAVSVIVLFCCISFIYGTITAGMDSLHATRTARHTTPATDATPIP